MNIYIIENKILESISHVILIPIEAVLPAYNDNLNVKINDDEDDDQEATKSTEYNVCSMYKREI